jgi:hypothetical protein
MGGWGFIVLKWKTLYLLLRGHSASLKGASSFHRLAMESTFTKLFSMKGGLELALIMAIFCDANFTSLIGGRLFLRLAINSIYNKLNST